MKMITVIMTAMILTAALLSSCAFAGENKETSAVSAGNREKETAKPKSILQNNPYVKEINIKDIKGVRIGNAEDAANGTGCTVIISESGAPAGVDVRGGGPASRETELLKTNASAERIHAILLAGGSAYGLQAATGVMNYLEEKGIGYPVGDGIVPLVVQSDICDLGCGSSSVRPDAKLAMKACEGAYSNNYRDGCYGAGTGATVGKMRVCPCVQKQGWGVTRFRSEIYKSVRSHV